MSKDMAIRQKSDLNDFSNEKLQLIKDTFCRGSTNDEFNLFVHVCKKTGLDPTLRQVYAVKRWDSNLKRESMTIQTGIDGYRLIAERTGKYCPGKETTFQYDSNGNLVSATAYVKKLTSDGTWHEIPATAFYSEYCQKTKEGKPMAMWAKMPHIMLSKCAESVCLRKAFPGDLSGIYTKEEMQQAEIEVDLECQAALHASVPEPKEYISHEDAKALEAALQSDPEYRDKILEFYKVSCFDEIEKKNFNVIYKRAMAHIQKKSMPMPVVEIQTEASVFEVTE